MYIRKSTRTYNGKTYTNHLLVESVQTAKGPRQRTICSLGSLEPAPAEDWLGLAHKLQSALQGQESLSGSSTEIQEWVEKARNKKKSTVGSDGDRSTVTVEPDQVQVEQAREAGPVHVGHQLWGQLEMNRILQQAGLSARACRLTEVMTLNRLICPSSEHAMPDCIQVVVGLVVDRDGFPKAHEIFDGNTQDRRSLDQMLDALEKRTGKKLGATVIVDRGMAFEENLEQIRKRKLHYLVAGRQSERNQWLEELENDDGWEQVHRTPSPRNPFQKKTRVEIKRQQKGDIVYLLCRSEGREEKDRAIREKQETKLLADLHRLQQRVAKGRLKKENKIQRAIGRLLERYPRVARYYELSYDAVQKNLSWNELTDKKATAKKLDGSYVLKTDRQDLTADEIWRTYILLTRVEDAFRDIKSPLMERPIFHHLQNRTQTHIFLCVLAYHLLAAIEHRFLQAGVHASWGTIRDQLRTHQVISIVLPDDHQGRVLTIRKATTPEPEHRQIYATLGITAEVMRHLKSWQVSAGSDEKNPKS